jgi:hypothetical protein
MGSPDITHSLPTTPAAVSMPVTIPLAGPFAENGLLARCTGKIIGRQRLAENRNTSFMMEHHGPVWKIFVGR